MFDGLLETVVDKVGLAEVVVGDDQSEVGFSVVEDE